MPGPSRTAATTPSTWPATAARPAAPASASWTRRWSTRPSPGIASCWGPALGGSESITRDRVLVSPAPGSPDACPSGAARAPADRWRLAGRSVRFTRAGCVPWGPAEAAAWIADQTPLDGLAAANLAAYIREQRERHRPGPERPGDRGRALSRRGGRLAGLHPHPLRRPHPCPLGPGAAGARSARGPGSRSRSCTPTTASSCASRTARTCRTIDRPAARPRRPGGPGHRGPRGHARCSPGSSARMPSARCCCRAGPGGAGVRSGPCASSPRPCWPRCAATRPSRWSWRPIVRP